MITTKTVKQYFFNLFLILLIFGVNESKAQGLNEKDPKTFKYFKIQANTKDDSVFTKLQEEMHIYEPQCSYKLTVNISDPDPSNHYVYIGYDNIFNRYYWNWLSKSVQQKLLNWSSPNKVNLANQQNLVKDNIVEIYPFVDPKIIQYTKNTLTNNGNSPLEIYDKDDSLITSIQPGYSKQFIMGGQKSIFFKRGNKIKELITFEKTDPEISIIAIGSGGHKASLYKLQNSIGFRVSVKSDYWADLNIQIIGPVIYDDKGNGVYDIVLKYVKDENQFNQIAISSKGPYHVSFIVRLTDKISGSIVSRLGQYTFGKW
ncbi:MAG: hypothetical protein ACOYN6_00910 [Ignavibacteria bacterium]